MANGPTVQIRGLEATVVVRLFTCFEVNFPWKEHKWEASVAIATQTGPTQHRLRIRVYDMCSAVWRARDYKIQQI